jgi:hypothetical protein
MIIGLVLGAAAVFLVVLVFQMLPPDPTVSSYTAARYMRHRSTDPCAGSACKHMHVLCIAGEPTIGDYLKCRDCGNTLSEWEVPHGAHLEVA